MRLHVLQGFSDYAHAPMLCDVASSINTQSHYLFMHSRRMDPRELLARLMKVHGLNPTSLARATGNRSTQPQIHKFMEGIVKEPRRSIPAADLVCVLRVVGIYKAV